MGGEEVEGTVVREEAIMVDFSRIKISKMADLREETLQERQRKRKTCEH
jgi:hypothetical protein